MRPIPGWLSQNLTRAERRAVVAWWRRLERPERRYLRVLAEQRPIEAAALPADQEAPDAFPEIDLYEYIVNHELAFAGERVFHICSAHPVAREAVRTRWIPASFACPLARQDCPMRFIVDETGGGDVCLDDRRTV